MADDTVSEEWRQIADFPDYAVSNLGRVRRERNAQNVKDGTLISVAAGPGGYPAITFCVNGKKYRKSVHTVVCAAFHGPRPSPKHQVAHWDGDPQNPVATNLRWATVKENSADCIRHGRKPKGADHAMAILNETDVLSIRARLANGERGVDLAAEFSVTQVTISAIKSRRIWKWL